MHESDFFHPKWYSNAEECRDLQYNCHKQQKLFLKLQCTLYCIGMLVPTSLRWGFSMIFLSKNTLRYLAWFTTELYSPFNVRWCSMCAGANSTFCAWMVAHPSANSAHSCVTDGVLTLVWPLICRVVTSACTDYLVRKLLKVQHSGHVCKVSRCNDIHIEMIEAKVFRTFITLLPIQKW